MILPHFVHENAIKYNAGAFAGAPETVEGSIGHWRRRMGGRVFRLQRRVRHGIQLWPGQLISAETTY